MSDSMFIFRGIAVEAGDIIEVPAGKAMERFAIMPSDSSSGDFAYAIDEYGQFVCLDTCGQGTVCIAGHDEVLAEMLIGYDALLEKMLTEYGVGQQILEAAERSEACDRLFGGGFPDWQEMSARLDVLGAAIATMVCGVRCCD